MMSLAIRRVLALGSRRFASSSASSGPADKPEPDLSDPNTLRISNQPILYAHYNPEVDTTSKTTVKVLQNEEDEYLLVNAYSQIGFTLTNRVTAMGPIALFPKTVFQWNVAGLESLTLESFSLFYLLDPKIDILVIGVGDRGNTLPPELLLALMNRRKLGVEILPTEHAVTTFNWLNSERRSVAGAFLPPKTIKYTEDDMFHLLQKRALNRYEPEEDLARQPSNKYVPPFNPLKYLKK